MTHFYFSAVSVLLKSCQGKMFARIAWTLQYTSGDIVVVFSKEIYLSGSILVTLVNSTRSLSLIFKEQMTFFDILQACE